LSAAAPVYNSKNEVVAVVGADISLEALNKIQTNLIFIMLMGVAFSVILSVLLAILLSSRISRPLKKLVNALNGIASNSGDLTQTINIKTRDEIEALADATNRMLENIKTIVKAIRNMSSVIDGNTSEMAHAMQNTSQNENAICSTMNEIASGAEEQMQNINQSYTMLNALSSIIDTLEANSEIIGRSASSTAGYAVDCLKAVNDLESQTTGNAILLKKTSDSAQILEEDAIEAEKIIEVISQIAKQTNMLALNAAIEAARAGEQGKGFAVVAEEIRHLSENTSVSVKQIAQNINKMRQQSGETSLALNDVVKTVSGQADSIFKTSGSISDINTVMSGITSVLSDVSSSINNIYKSKQSIMSLNSKIQQTSELMATSTNQIISSQEEQHTMVNNVSERLRALNEMAHQLEHTVNSFKI